MTRRMHARWRLTSQAAAIFGPPGVVGVYDDGERTPRTEFERHQLLLQIGLRPAKWCSRRQKAVSTIHSPAGCCTRGFDGRGFIAAHTGTCLMQAGSVSGQTRGTRNTLIKWGGSVHKRHFPGSLPRELTSWHVIRMAAVVLARRIAGGLDVRRQRERAATPVERCDECRARPVEHSQGMGEHRHPSKRVARVH